MAVLLSRDHAITVPLLSTCGTASFLSRDGQEVKVALAPLLGASTLARSMVAESHLHPCIHGPLVLSFTVASDVLVSVGEMLGVGESIVKEETIEEVAQVLDLLGVEANLSQCRKNTEYEHFASNEEDIATNEEDIVTSEEDTAINDDEIKLEIVFESISEVETCLREGDFDKAMNNSLKECYVNIKKIGDRPEESYGTNKKVAAKTVNICNVCEYSARSASELEVHLRRHTGEKPFKCNICTYSGTTTGELKLHNRIHTGEKLFKCSICTYSSSRASGLKRHFRIHTGEKPHKCSICTYSSSNASGLKRHIRIHTGERPYTCRICDSSFSQSGQLRAHCRVHSREKPFKCKICAYSCSYPGSLKMHIRIHTGEKP